MPLFNGAMVSTGASQSGGGRLVDIGRNRQLDVLIHISLTLAIKLQPNSAAGGHHQRWDIGVAAFGRT